MRRTLVALIFIAASLAACHTTGSGRVDDDPTVGEAMTRPLRDLSLVREAPPPLLVEARRAPYHDGAGTCAEILSEVAALNAVLGPDVDEVGEDNEDGTEIAASLIEDALDIPFSGIVRRLTGARERERARAQAVVAGVARRGFLRGLAEARDCERP